MQRKRNKDFYHSSVELGTAIIPSVRMRKMTTKKLLKYAILIVIGFIIYSIYQKYQLAGHNDIDDNDIDSIFNAGDSNEHVYRDADAADAADAQDEQDEEVPRRLKEHINRVFGEMKEKQELKEREALEQDVFEEFNAANGLVDDDDEDKNVDEVFGEEDKNVDLNEIPDDMFEPIDEEKEKEDLEIEREIEELLADAFNENKNDIDDTVVEDNVNADINIPDEVVNAVNDGVEKDIREEIEKPVGLQDRPNLVPPVAAKKVNPVRRIHPLEIERLNNLANINKAKNDDDHEFPPFVTAARQTIFKQVMQLVASIQQHLPGRKVYIYDIDLKKDQKKQLMAICGVRMRLFMLKLFPSFVHNLDNLHWKPLVMQTALAEFGHMTWVNPNFRLGTQQLAPLVHESHEKGILVIGQSASYSTFSATHPDMLKFITTDQEKLSRNPHIEIRAVMVHNTKEVHEQIMQVFTACALEPSCLAPPGAKWQCRFDFTGRKHADCHRYDESALNILLKNMFSYDMGSFTRRNNYFRPYDESYRPKLKTCRDVRDIRDSEL